MTDADPVAGVMSPPSRLRRLLSPLRPRAWKGRVPGPVFQKEVWSINKRLSTSWIRLAYGLVLLTIVCFTFGILAFDTYSPSLSDAPNGTSGETSGRGAAATLQQYQTLAPAVTVTIAWTQFILLSLVACALGAPAIADERRAGTLGTLLSTPLTAWQIILGKLTSRMLELCILMFLSAPLLLAIRTFGGVPAWYIGAFFSLTFATSMVACQLAIYLSIKSKRSGAAFLSSATLLGTLLVGIPLMAFVASLMLTGAMRAPAPPSWMQWIFMPSSPGVMLFLSTELLAPDAPFSRWGSRTWIPSVFSLLAIWGMLFALSTIRLRSAMAAEAGGGPVLKAPKASKLAKQDGPTTLQDAAESGTTGKAKRRSSGVRAGVSRLVSDPAILWRERELRLFKGSTFIIRSLVLIVSVAMIAIYWLGQMHPMVCIVLSGLGILALLINAGGVNAASIAGEREGRTLDVLLATPILSSDVIRQKFWGGLWRLWPIGLVLLAHLIVFQFARPISYVLSSIDHLLPNKWQVEFDRTGLWKGATASLLAVPLFIAAVLPPVIMLCASGVFFSTITKRTTRASVFNVMFGLGLWVGLPMMLGMFVAVTANSRTLTAFVTWPNPFVLGLTTLVTTVKERPKTFDTFKDTFSLPNNSGLSFFEFCGLLIVVGGAYLGVAAIFLMLASHRLRRDSAGHGGS